MCLLFYMFIRFVYMEAIRSIELLDWTQKIFLGVLNAVPEKLVLLILFTIKQWMNTNQNFDEKCHCYHWMQHHSDSDIKVTYVFPLDRQRGTKLITIKKINYIYIYIYIYILLYQCVCLCVCVCACACVCVCVCIQGIPF